MRGASRVAFAEARDRLTTAVSDPEVAATVGDELFAVVTLLDREPAVRRALADSTAARSARTGLVRDLFGQRVSPATLDVLTGLASAHWSVPRDIADAAEELAVLATAASAAGPSQLDDVEDELFRFGRIASGEPELIAALASPRYPDEQKRELLNNLLAGKVAPPDVRGVALDLTGPDGERWWIGPERGRDIIAGSASEWCRVATRRVRPEATSLEVTTPLAAEALKVARAYLADSTS